MTPNDQGRFCGSCQKTVVDFTRMSDAAIFRFMEATTSSVCGRMSNDQQEKHYHALPANSTSNSFSLRALVLGTAISTFSALQAQAQGKVVAKGEMKAEPIEQTALGDVELSITDRNILLDSLFTGSVIDYSMDRFVTGVSITVYDADGNELVTTLSNENGEFQLPLDAKKHPYSAVFRKEEYDDVTYVFSDLLTTRGIVVELGQEKNIKMGMMIKVDPEDK
ncbi:MAG: carboxypeptidase regulatory-like domain-containing protein [Flavobacteriia bacterium]|nr:carboxypeptidase regulatory-like domain-containing protein [Flavobacteriia bacterium]